jgi:hypothetical protein
VERPCALPSVPLCFVVVGARRSKHNRILSGAVIRVLSEPVIVRCDPKHHRSYLRILGVFGQRPHRFGSHAPVRCGPEKIVRVGGALVSQTAPSIRCNSKHENIPSMQPLWRRSSGFRGPYRVHCDLNHHARNAKGRPESRPSRHRTRARHSLRVLTSQTNRRAIRSRMLASQSRAISRTHRPTGIVLLAAITCATHRPSAP